MTDALTKEGIKFIIARLLENAADAVEESKKNPDDEYSIGRELLTTRCWIF